VPASHPQHQVSEPLSLAYTQAARLGALSISCAVCGASKGSYCYPGQTHGFCRERWSRARTVAVAAMHEAEVHQSVESMAKRRQALLLDCPTCGTTRGVYCHRWKRAFCRERWQMAKQHYEAIRGGMTS
jgi:hypothetical protein